LRLLVTGANGFVGEAVARRARDSDWDVGVIVRDGASPHAIVGRSYASQDIARVVEAFRPDAIVHAAGGASPLKSVSAPSESYADTVAPFAALLDGLRMASVRPRIVLVSSAAVYGNPHILPVDEGAKPAPISPYGEHKLICERLGREFSEQAGAGMTSARVFSTFGERQRRLLIWDLFEKVTRESEVVLYGTGDETRDFLHVDALADQLVALACADVRGFAAVNVGSGVARRIADVVDAVRQRLGSSKPIRFTGDRRPGDPVRWAADIRKFSALTGQAPADTFETALASVLEAWQ
jgi:UDP-glucose 4-epimerase